MPFKDTFEGQTFSCTHTDDNSICDKCLGKEKIEIDYSDKIEQSFPKDEINWNERDVYNQDGTLIRKGIKPMTTTHNNWDELRGEFRKEFLNHKFVNELINWTSPEKVTDWWLSKLDSEIHKALEAHKEEVVNDIRDLCRKSSIKIPTQSMIHNILALPSLLKDNK